MRLNRAGQPFQGALEGARRTPSSFNNLPAPAGAKTQLKTMRAPLCMPIWARRRDVKANETPRASRVALDVFSRRLEPRDAVKRSKLVVRRGDRPDGDVGDGRFLAPTVRRHMQFWC